MTSGMHTTFLQWTRDIYRHTGMRWAGLAARCRRRDARSGVRLHKCNDVRLDKFKQINDEFGHAAGDAVLQAVGQALAGQTRLGDIACRYGGDEFIVVLPGSGPEAACRRAEDLLAAIAAFTVLYADHTLFTKSSCGIAAYPEHSSSGEDLLRFTDRALYAAKAKGGNCVFVHGQALDPTSWLQARWWARTVSAPRLL